MDKKEVIDFFKDLVIIVVIVLIIRTFLIMPFQISGQSMYSSYYDKEFIIVDRLSYRIWGVKRGDVVVFKPHIWEDKKYFLKRVIAIPWDELKIEDWNVFLKKTTDEDFIELNEQYLNEENKWFTFIWSDKTLTNYKLLDDQYFVMWDNRNHSTDSRQCFQSCSMEWRTNFAKREDIVWHVLIDLWYFNFKSFSFFHPNLWIDTHPKFFDSFSSFEY